MGIRRLGIRIAICDGVSPIPVSVRLRFFEKRLCRGVWIVIKVGHASNVTNHTRFIVEIDLCDFEVFPEGGY